MITMPGCRVLRWRAAQGRAGQNLDCQSRNPTGIDIFMPVTDEEKTKARRAIVILYICMITGIGLPILLYFILR